MLIATADLVRDDVALADLGARLIDHIVVRCSDSKVVIDRIDGAAHRDDRFRSASPHA